MTLDVRYEILRLSCGQFIPFVQNAGHTYTPKYRLTSIITTQKNISTEHANGMCTISATKMLLTPNACCVVILICRRFYRFVSTTNTGGVDVSFPNRILFTGIQTGRRIVYLDDRVSSRIDEREGVSAFSGHPTCGFRRSRPLKSRLEVQRIRLQIVVIPEKIPLIKESRHRKILHNLERRCLYTGEQWS